jgi:hypothetical protein
MPIERTVWGRAVLVVALGISLALGVVATTRPLLQITASLATSAP